MSETIEDIVREMRYCAEKNSAWYCTTVEFEEFVDRIENAVELERKEWRKMLKESKDIIGILEERCDAIEQCQTEEETTEISSQVGNAAKMREALQEARRFVSASAHRTDRDLLVMDDEKRGAYVLTPKETLIKIDAALSARPRNCDVMDWRTAWAKWRTEIHPQNPCGYAEAYRGTEQFMDWYMSETKGETK